MSIYCKAYKLEKLRRFPGWFEKADNARTMTSVENGKNVEIARKLSDEDFLYLHENLIVTDGIFVDKNVIFDQITPEWQKYCTEELEFEVPTY